MYVSPASLVYALVIFLLLRSCYRFMCGLLVDHFVRVRMKEDERLEAEMPARRERAFQAYLDAVEAKRVAAVTADAEAAAADPSRKAWLDWIDRLPPLTAPLVPRPSPTQAAPRLPVRQGARLPQ